MSVAAGAVSRSSGGLRAPAPCRLLAPCLPPVAHSELQARRASCRRASTSCRCAAAEAPPNGHAADAAASVLGRPSRRKQYDVVVSLLPLPRHHSSWSRGQTGRSPRPAFVLQPHCTYCPNSQAPERGVPAHHAGQSSGADLPLRLWLSCMAIQPPLQHAGPIQPVPGHCG